MKNYRGEKTFLLTMMVSLGAPAWFLCLPHAQRTRLWTGNKMKVTLGVAGFGGNYRKEEAEC